MKESLVTEAFKKGTAKQDCFKSTDLIIHSNRGGEYAENIFKNLSAQKIFFKA